MKHQRVETVPQPAEAAQPITEEMESAIARQSALLPLSWDIPSNKEIAWLARRLRRELREARKQSDGARFEAALLLGLILQTGLPPHRLRLHAITRHEQGLPTSGLSEAIHIATDGCFIAVTSRLPADAKRDRIPAVTSLVVLPLLQILGDALTHPLPWRSSPGPCFTQDFDDLCKRARLLLRGGRNWRKRTTKANRQLNAARGWLAHRLQIVPGGDPAFCSLLGIERRGISTTLTHYVTVRSQRLWKVYRTAVEIAPCLAVGPTPNWPDATWFGRPDLPDWSDMRPVLNRLQSLIRRPISPLAGLPRDPTLVRRERLDGLAIDADRHLAMMLYTFILVSFATGQRGLSCPPKYSEIDEETGCAWVTEKARHELGGRRAVWHPEAALKQLRLYERYLDDLEVLLGRQAPPLAEQLKAVRSQKERAGVYFFTVRRGKLTPLSPFQLCSEGKRLGWKHQPNAGRRWLRSVLTGLVPHEALAAQFGHVMGGIDPWRGTSALDPRGVRQALSRVVPDILEEARLDPYPSGKGLARRSARRERSDIPPDRSRPQDLSFRAICGGVLASAIWNGALLAEGRWDEAVEQFSRKLGQAEFWLDFDSSPRIGQTRWWIDGTTRTAIKEAPPPPNLKARCDNANAALAAWFGSRVLVELFLERARRRWQTLLPPYLYEIACGRLEIHSRPARKNLNAISSDDCAGISDMRPNPFSGLERLIDSVTAKHLPQPRPFDDRTGLRSHHRYRQRQLVQADLLENAPLDPGFKSLSDLQKWIFLTAVRWCSHERRGEKQRGFAINTIKEKLHVLGTELMVRWCKAAPSARCLADIPKADVLASVNGKSPDCRQALTDLASVALQRTNDPKQKSYYEDLVRALQGYPEAYTVQTVTPRQYQEMIDPAVQGSYSRALIVLLYRTGLRFSELGTVDFARRDRSGSPSPELLLDHGNRRLKTFQSRRRVPIDILLPSEELQVVRNALSVEVCRKKPSKNQLTQWIKESSGRSVWSIWPFRHAFATNLLAALLWPKDTEYGGLEEFDTHFMQNREKLRAQLIGSESMGMVSLHAVALVMGHTTPKRTRQNYAHNIETILAAYVERKSTKRHAWVPKMHKKPASHTGESGLSAFASV